MNQHKFVPNPLQRAKGVRNIESGRPDVKRLWCAFTVVPMEGVEPTHSHEYQILSLARLPIPPHRPPTKSRLL
jgi:hypothetical protein